MEVKTVRLPTFFEIFFFNFPQKMVIWVWNGMELRTEFSFLGWTFPLNYSRIFTNSNLTLNVINKYSSVYQLKYFWLKNGLICEHLRFYESFFNCFKVHILSKILEKELLWQNINMYSMKAVFKTIINYMPNYLFFPTNIYIFDITDRKHNISMHKTKLFAMVMIVKVQHFIYNSVIMYNWPTNSSFSFQILLKTSTFSFWSSL